MILLYLSLLTEKMLIRKKGKAKLGNILYGKYKAQYGLNRMISRDGWKLKGRRDQYNFESSS